MKNLFSFAMLGLAFLALLGCTSSSSMLDRIERDVAKYPVYSIILEDMRTEGNFFKDYYHKYKVVFGERAGDSLQFNTYSTDWQLVDEDLFRRYQDNLGMTLISKTDTGDVVTTPQPAAYQYVGDERYGRWRTDSSGNSFWEFYGKYAMLQALLGGWNRPIYYNDWDDYRGYRSRGQTYYGKNKQWGTFGEATKKTNPTFFERRQMRESAAKQSFTDKLKQRTRRSNMSKSRSRSSGFGK